MSVATLRTGPNADGSATATATGCVLAGCVAAGSPTSGCTTGSSSVRMICGSGHSMGCVDGGAASCSIGWSCWTHVCDPPPADESEGSLFLSHPARMNAPETSSATTNEMEDEG